MQGDDDEELEAAGEADLPPKTLLPDHGPDSDRSTAEAFSGGYSPPCPGWGAGPRIPAAGPMTGRSSIRASPKARRNCFVV